MPSETQTLISPEAYLEQEAKAAFKSEYRNGEVVAMSGAQIAHNRLVAILLGILYRCLGQECEAFPSDLLVKMPEKCNKYVYPDITVVCDDLKTEKHSGLDVLLNPTVVIEVLSSSTRAYDQSDKMKCYLALESLQQYVLVDSERKEVMSYTKNSEEDWLYRTFREGDFKLYSCEITLEELYKNVTLEQ